LSGLREAGRISDYYIGEIPKESDEDPATEAAEDDDDDVIIFEDAQPDPK
jgi:hypothetical protein